MKGAGRRFQLFHGDDLPGGTGPTGSTLGASGSITGTRDPEHTVSGRLDVGREHGLAGSSAMRPGTD